MRLMGGKIKSDIIVIIKHIVQSGLSLSVLNEYKKDIKRI